MRKFAVVLAALSACGIQGCITRAEIKATIWDNNGLSPELCETVKPPELRSDLAKQLWQYGFYRRLDRGKFEFMAFCDPKAVHWLAVYDQDFNEILDKTLPEGGTTP